MGGRLDAGQGPGCDARGRPGQDCRRRSDHDGHRPRRADLGRSRLHPRTSGGAVDAQRSRLPDVHRAGDGPRAAQRACAEGEDAMIDFERPSPTGKQRVMLQTVAENMMRPVSRQLDEHEHEIPWDYINFMHMAMKATGAGSLAPKEAPKKDAEGKERPRIGYQMLAFMLEMLSWGDVGIYLCTPGGGLGAAAVQANGTPEQNVKFLTRFGEEKPAFGAMAMTESQAGSDTSAIRTTAVLDKEKNQWVLNGEKIFVTGGQKSLEEGNGLVVVWATIDPSAGRAGMRPFVVEAGTPGVKVTKLEHKLGIRASDTVSISLVDARLPFDHILGRPPVGKTT